MSRPPKQYSPTSDGARKPRPQNPKRQPEPRRPKSAARVPVPDPAPAVVEGAPAAVEADDILAGDESADSLGRPNAFQRKAEVDREAEADAATDFADLMASYGVDARDAADIWAWVTSRTDRAEKRPKGDRVRDFSDMLGRYGVTEADAKIIWGSLVKAMKAGEKWAFDRIDAWESRLKADQEGASDAAAAATKVGAAEVEQAREVLRELAERLGAGG